MKRPFVLTFALAASAFLITPPALAQQEGAAEHFAAAEVQPLSDAELQSVLDVIHSVAKGDWSEGYAQGVDRTGGDIFNFFVLRQVRSNAMTQETADKIKEAIEGLETSLKENATGSGNRFDGQAAGTKAMVDGFAQAIRTMAEDGALTAEMADTLATGADQMTGRATPEFFMQSAMREVTSKHLNVYGLANNRAVSDEQVKVIVDALNEVKTAYPDAASGVDQQIFKVSHLTIGREAPNITGTDTDDVEFALKEYRGKVVVLDFWGDW